MCSFSRCGCCFFQLWMIEVYLMTCEPWLAIYGFVFVFISFMRFLMIMQSIYWIITICYSIADFHRYLWQSYLHKYSKMVVFVCSIEIQIFGRSFCFLCPFEMHRQLAAASKLQFFQPILFSLSNDWKISINMNGKLIFSIVIFAHSDSSFYFDSFTDDRCARISDKISRAL